MTPTPDLVWDQTRIAAAFGVAPNTVQSSWRHETGQAVRAHLAQFFHDLDGDLHAVDERTLMDAVGPTRLLTAARWAEVVDRFGLPELAMPDKALPLPDVIVAGRPGWTPETIRGWAEATRRIDEATGEFKRCSPPGRPAGIVETAKRRPRVPAAA